MSNPEPLDLAKSLARALLMTDLLTHRLLTFYVSSGSEANQEMAYALELESQHLIDTLNSAQAQILDS